MKHLRTFTEEYRGTQRELADLIGISQPHMSMLLSGKKRPSLDLAIHIEKLTSGAVTAFAWGHTSKKRKKKQWVY